jgi:hypothetical protein
MSVVVMTAIAGRYDPLRSQASQTVSADWRAYVDEPTTRTPPWDVTLNERDADEAPVVWAKRYKILGPTDLAGEYRFAIWIDGKVEVISPTFVEECLAAVERSDGLAAWPHPTRRCIYAEASGARSRAPHATQDIEAQIARYRREGHPRNAGLFEGAVLVHDLRSEARTRLMEAWWQECMAGSMRDQLSLPVVARAMGFRIGALPTSLYPRSQSLMDRSINVVSQRVPVSGLARKLGLRRPAAPSGGGAAIVSHSHVTSSPEPT